MHTTQKEAVVPGTSPIVPALSRRSALRFAALLGAAAAVPVALTGCGNEDDALALTATDLTASAREAASFSVTGEDSYTILTNERTQAASYALATNLLRTCMQVDTAQDARVNTFISPLSILFALALAQNGAAGATLDELTATTGLDTDALNSYLGTYARYLETGDLWGAGPDSQNNGEDEDDETTMPLHLANSLWIRETDTLEVHDDYLAACANELDASAFSAPFDATTVDDINAWVGKHTSHMVERLINEIPDEARLYLINALAFEDAWEEPYEDSDVKDDFFIAADSMRQSVRMMRSREGSYLENDQFQGFVKPYADYRYAFVGLLPREGIALGDAVAALDGAALEALLQPIANAEADAGLPKFKLSYETELTDVLGSLGMSSAFDPERADFAPMGTDEDGPLYISQILHKTYIDVNEEGTRAAATTSIGMAAGASAPMDEPVVYEVILDRPFAFLIIDYQVGIPVFAGAMNAMPNS